MCFEGKYGDFEPVPSEKDYKQPKDAARYREVENK